MNYQPAVSVIIPCFNQGKTVGEAVDSVLKQTVQDFEIIVVNDGSTDAFTNTLLSNYRRPRTKVIMTRNRGLAEARNTGIRRSNGRFILPLDADDRISPDYLAKTVPILDANDSVIIVYGNTEHFGVQTGHKELPDFSRELMLSHNLIVNTALFRRSDYERTKGYNPNLLFAYEDWDFWLSLMESRPDGEVRKLPETLLYYRLHANSMLNSLTKTQLRYSALRVFLNHIALYRRYGIDPTKQAAGKEPETDCDESKWGFPVHPLRYWRAVSRTFIAQKLFLGRQWLLPHPTPAIRVWPKPARTVRPDGFGNAIVAWRVGNEQSVEVHVDAPDGPLFSRSLSSSTAVTGRWVRNGTMFYLQDMAGNLPLAAANTLATAEARGMPRAGTRISKLKRSVRALRARFKATGIILMYHRVADGELDPWQLRVTPRHFAEHLEVIRRFGRPESLRDAVQALRSGRLPRRTIVLTFDDGYHDNIVNATPLLERQGVPATFFMTSGSLKAQEEFWWDELAETLSLMQAADEDMASLIRTIHGTHALLQAMPRIERRDFLDQLRNWLPETHRVRSTHSTMTRQDVIKLDRSRLFEIGSHTVTHPFLPSLSTAVQLQEIQQGKLELENIVGHEVTSFAYPHGRHTSSTHAFVRDSGFECACSVGDGTFAHDTNRFCLPRVHVRDVDGSAMEAWLTACFEN